MPITTEGQITHFHTPPHEVALHRVARVKAMDGYVGQVDEFLVDPISEQITHLVNQDFSIGRWQGGDYEATADKDAA